jgi:hypothetical protein
VLAADEDGEGWEKACVGLPLSHMGRDGRGSRVLPCCIRGRRRRTHARDGIVAPPCASASPRRSSRRVPRRADAAGRARARPARPRGRRRDGAGRAARSRRRYEATARGSRRSTRSGRAPSCCSR